MWYPSYYDFSGANDHTIRNVTCAIGIKSPIHSIYNEGTLLGGGQSDAGSNRGNFLTMEYRIPAIFHGLDCTISHTGNNRLYDLCEDYVLLARRYKR